MNRREVLTSMAAITATAASPVHAQQSGWVRTAPYVIEAPPLSPQQPSNEDRKKQYAICKERGHSPADIHFTTTLTASIFRDTSQEPTTCRYCGTCYRFVTTMEETNVPNG